MMSKLRKKFQDKLRQKFGYQTSSDRGAYLIKPNATDSLADKQGSNAFYSRNGRKCTKVHDISFEIERYSCGKNENSVFIKIDTFYDYGQSKPAPAERFEKAGTGCAIVSVDELELICKIAREVINERKEK